MRAVRLEACVPRWGSVTAAPSPQAHSSLFSLPGARSLGRNCGSEAAARGPSAAWEPLDPRESWVFLVRVQLPDSVTLGSLGS